VAEQPNRLSAIAFGVFALAAMLPGVVAAKAVPPGRYECWFYTTPQHLKDFTLSGSTYIDASGVSGSVRFPAISSRSEAAISMAGQASTMAEIRRPSASTTPMERKCFCVSGARGTGRRNNNEGEALLLRKQSSASKGSVR
jgi:hypothetical protein